MDHLLGFPGWEGTLLTSPCSPQSGDGRPWVWIFRIGVLGWAGLGSAQLGGEAPAFQLSECHLYRFSAWGTSAVPEGDTAEKVVGNLSPPSLWLMVEIDTLHF